MHRLVVTYGNPEDPEAFDAHYRDTHVPLVKQMPGLQQFSIGKAQPVDPRTTAPYLVAELDFESAEAMGAAFASPEGQATAADVANFATGGATMSHFAIQEL